MNNGKRLAAVAVIAALIVAAAAYYFAVWLPEKNEREEKERLVREYYGNKLSLYMEENERYADHEVDVAFLGDSLTDGYDLQRYYPDYTVSNRGIGGETSHGLEQRMQISLYDLKPKVAVILIGGNNLDTMLDNYERMIADVKDTLPDTSVVLCSLTAMGGDWGRKNQLAAYNNVIIKKLAEKYGFSFVDLYTPLLNVDTGEIYSEYTIDGAHLTPEGYRVVTDAIAPALEALLGERTP